jgi:hypothetical protein
MILVRHRERSNDVPNESAAANPEAINGIPRKTAIDSPFSPIPKGANIQYVNL